MTKMLNIFYNYRVVWTKLESTDIIDITKLLMKELSTMFSGSVSDDNQVSSFDLNLASIGMMNSIILQMFLETNLLIKISQDLRKGPLNPKVIIKIHSLCLKSDVFVYELSKICLIFFFLFTGWRFNPWCVGKRKFEIHHYGEKLWITFWWPATRFLPWKHLRRVSDFFIIYEKVAW